LIDEPNSCATDVTNSDFVCVSPGPVASFYTSPNTLAINNQLVSFQNTSSNADSFIWDFGNGSTSTQINPETNINIINETLTVTLTAFSGDNCESTASITFEMPESDLYVPNSFTPDADEHNQSWGPVFLSGFDKFNFELLVFNRWGETVWESRDADGRWDGKYSNKQLNCPEGIYTWKITYKKKNSDDRTVRTGHITLIR
jgi:gliding motility-associated-like protein